MIYKRFKNGQNETIYEDKIVVATNIDDPYEIKLLGAYNNSIEADQYVSMARQCKNNFKSDTVT